MPTYSYAMPPQAPSDVTYTGESDFAKKIQGKSYDDVLAVVDELMSTISIINPNLYNGVMRKLSEI